MHSNAMSSGASDQAGSYGRAEASRRAEAEITGPADGIPEATVARLPIYLRALYSLAERGISTVASEELAAAAPEVKLYRLYRERIDQFRASPPAADWDGVFGFTTR